MVFMVFLVLIFATFQSFVENNKLIIITHLLSSITSLRRIHTSIQSIKFIIIMLSLQPHLNNLLQSLLHQMASSIISSPAIHHSISIHHSILIHLSLFTIPTISIFCINIILSFLTKILIFTSTRYSRKVKLL